MHNPGMLRIDIAAARSVEKVSASRSVANSVLERKLGQIKILTSAELGALVCIMKRSKSHTGGTILLGEGPAIKHPRFLLSGWACRQLILENGRRQIFGFLLPGDVLAPDCDGLMVSSVVALTEVTISEPCSAGEGEVQSIFSIASNALLQERERLLHQQVLRLGSMNALQRTAHLVLELSDRLALVGLSDGKIIPFPLTQEVLADALGMSHVHVNRTLKQLRSAGAILGPSRQSLQIHSARLTAILEGESTGTMRSTPAWRGRAVAI